jgi:hypothetical protein
MAKILGIQTVDTLFVISTDTNPTAAGGTPAPIGSIALTADGSGSFTKTGALNTDWTLNVGIVTLADFVTDVGNTTTTETDLYSYTLPANILKNNGESLIAFYSLQFSNNINSKELKVYFGGQLLFDSGKLLNLLTAYTEVSVKIIRVSSTVVRYSVDLLASNIVDSGWIYIPDSASLNDGDSIVLPNINGVFTSFVYDSLSGGWTPAGGIDMSTFSAYINLSNFAYSAIWDSVNNIFYLIPKIPNIFLPFSGTGVGWVSGTSISKIVKNGELTGLDLTTTNILKITGQATLTNDIVAKQGTINLLSAV